MMPIQSGDVLNISAETQALYKTIDFKQETPVQQGVKNFVDWYKGYYQYN